MRHFEVDFEQVPQEVTSWSNDTHIYKPAELHAVIKTVIAGRLRERHLYGQAASGLAELLGISELSRVVKAVAAVGGK